MIRCVCATAGSDDSMMERTGYRWSVPGELQSAVVAIMAATTGPSLNATVRLRRRRGTGQFHCRDRSCELTPTAAPSMRRRDPTAVLVMPTPCRNPSHTGSSMSQRELQRCLCCSQSYCFIYEAKTQAGGGVIPSAALIVLMPSHGSARDSDASQ